MNRTWKFSDIEFFVLWQGLKEDFLPWPLVFTSRTMWHDDFMREIIETQDRLRGKVDRSFGDVLKVLHEPDIRIDVHGWGGADRMVAEASIRIIGARRGDFGIVVTQLPGETAMHAAGFTVDECDAMELASRVVAGLPEVAAGHLADLVLPTAAAMEEVDYKYGQSDVFDLFDDSVADRAQQFLDAPAPRMGTIDIVQGHSLFGPRGVTRHQLEWRELADDGRYVIDDQHPPIVSAVDSKRLIVMINTRVAAVVRAIKDERV